MNVKILQDLRTWRGRRYVERKLEENGFCLHQKWQKRLLSFCENESHDIILQYWDECAFERVMSGGSVNPETRAGFTEGSYRSAFLDGLVVNADKSDNSRMAGSAFKCIFDYNKKKYGDRTFSYAEVEYLDNCKRIEMALSRVTCDQMTDTRAENKRDIVPDLAFFAGNRGFSAQKAGFRKKNKDGFIYKINYDFGTNPLLSGRIPLKFLISHDLDKEFSWNITRFDLLFPGFFSYGYFHNREQLTYGLKAHVELFDIFSQSFFT